MCMDLSIKFDEIFSGDRSPIGRNRGEYALQAKAEHFLHHKVCEGNN